jgi:hypothetical protein
MAQEEHDNLADLLMDDGFKRDPDEVLNESLQLNPWSGLPSYGACVPRCAGHTDVIHVVIFVVCALAKLMYLPVVQLVW